MVDARLRQLAAEFAEAIIVQGKALSDPMDDARIRETQQRVAEAKQAFWTMNEGARRWGTYKVEQSIKAYLSPTLRVVD